MSDKKETKQTSSEIKKDIKGAPEVPRRTVGPRIEDPTKFVSKRGRKIKYKTDEERIEARRRQQKAYRERKRNELLKLKELFEKENGLKESLRSKAPKLKELTEKEGTH